VWPKPPTPYPQSPIPNPQSPITVFAKNKKIKNNTLKNKILIKNN